MRITCSSVLTKILPSPILEVDHVLGTTVQLGVALLAAETLHFGDRDALHADFGQRLAHVVQLERLDDRHDQFHAHSSFRQGGRGPQTGILPGRRGVVASPVAV